MANYGNFQTLAVNEYTPMIYAAVQQMRSRTERFMRVYGMNSRQRRFQIIDPVSSTQITDLYGATNPQQAEFRQRWLKTKIFKSTHEISRTEMQQAGTIDSPLPRIVDAERMEMQRRRDLVAVDGLIGTAWTGENGDIPVAFNEKANTIPVGYVQSGTYAASGLTFDKIVRAKTIFGMRNVLGQDVERQDLGGPEMVILCTHEELAALYGIKEFTNILYSDQRPIASGYIDNVLGVRFIALTADMLPFGSRPLGTAADPTNGASTPNVRTLIAFTMNSVAFGVLEELFVRIEELPTNQYVWQTYSEIAMGATRIEDKGVLKIDVSGSSGNF